METQDQTIKTSFITKIEFDELQLSYRKKGMRKTQDEMVKMLMNTNIEYNKIMPKYSEALEKISALTSELEKRELEIEELRK